MNTKLLYLCIVLAGVSLCISGCDLFFTKYTIEIDIEGKGNVQINPQRDTYTEGTEIALTAIPHAGWEFSHWSGDAEGTETVLKLTMDADKQIKVVFQREQYGLTIAIEGEGDVKKTVIESADTDEYPYETVLELQAIPREGWEFSHWSGDAEGTEPLLELIMDAEKWITAVFQPRMYTLSILKEGEGEVITTVLETADADEYPYGTSLELLAVPAEHWTFVGWETPHFRTENPININVLDHTTVKALFSDGSGHTLEGTLTIEHHWPVSVVESSGPNALPLKADVSEIAPVYREGNTGEMIIGLHSHVPDEKRISLFQALDVEVLEYCAPLQAYLVEVGQGNLEEALDAAWGMADVRYAEPNQIFGASHMQIPNDEYYSYQWHYPQIRLPQAWTKTTGASWVRIAVLDTGVDVGHPDLGGTVDVSSGYNFIDNNHDFSDEHGHGTHVAGTIGADTNNHQGVAGVMWDVSIVPVKVLDDDGSGSTWSVTQGILYSAGLLEEPAIDKPVHIINMSLGGGSFSHSMQDAVSEARAEGILLVAASGNSNSSVQYPARYDEVIAVGAVDYNYPHAPRRAPYSNYGPEIDVVAPGGNTNVDSNENNFVDGVLSPYFSFNGGEKEYKYSFLQGTSMAAPHVSGVMGLMLAAGVQTEDILPALQRSSMDLGSEGFDSFYGHGLINAYWAVHDVQTIRVLVGNRQGDTIDFVTGTTVSLEERTFTLESIPDGIYRVYAWIDVQNTGSIDVGDYLAESEELLFQEGLGRLVDLILKEEG